MKHCFITLAILSACFLLFLRAEDPSSFARQIPQPNPNQNAIRFIQNQGQWGDIPLFNVRLNGGNIWLTRQGLTYAFYSGLELEGHAHPSVEDIGKPIQHHVYTVNFVGANPNAEIRTDHLFESYHNYFMGNDPSRWASRVPLYGVITYVNIYPKIDFRLYGFGDALKYEFIVHPGGNPSDIQLKYEGVDQLHLQNEDLHVSTSVTEVVEQAPLSYQYDQDVPSQIPSNYKLRDNILSFSFPESYDTQQKLIIDPIIRFSSFTGSFSDNWGFTSTYDLQGNAYAGGIIYNDGAFGTFLNGYPTSIGAFQQSYQGGERDVTISKFREDGRQLIYSTYIGGRDAEQPHSLIVNKQNELLILGRTSSNNFPTTASSIDRTLNGGFDLFVSKLSADGTQLLASTYLGGTEDDGLNYSLLDYGHLRYNYGDDARGEIMLDAQDHVFIVSPTQSNNFPVTPNAFQRNFGGQQDGVIVKMASDLSNLLWSSYLGGNLHDVTYGIQVNERDEVYVTGGTESSNFPGTIGGANPGFSGGGSDGFVSKISSDGSRIIQSTFIGTNSLDQSFLIQLDGNQDVYVVGQSEGNMPVINPPSGQVYFTNTGKQFITKFNNNLDQVIYQSRFGSGSVPNISPTAFLVDQCQNVYVTGWGGSENNQGDTRNLPLTADAFQRSTDGSDIYMVVFSRNMRSILYGSYIGGNNNIDPGEHLDGGTCRFDPSGVIYHAVCAGCGGASVFPTTPGVVSRFNNSTNCNLALFKIEFDFAGVEANFIPRDSSDQQITGGQGCAPFRVRFENTSVEANNAQANTTYFWDFGDGNSSNLFEPEYTFTQPGLYNVMLIITDSLSCNIADTTFRIIEVFQPPTATIDSIGVLCYGDSVQLAGSGGTSFQWIPNTNISDPTSPSPIVFPNLSSTYTLVVTDDNGCSSQTSIPVQVQAPLNPDAGNDTTFCSTGGLRLNVNTDFQASYAWSPAQFLDDANVANPLLGFLDSPTTFTVTVTDSIGCSAEDSVTIELLSLEVSGDTTICEGEEISLAAITQATNISWTPAASLDDPTSFTPLAQPNTTTTYIASVSLSQSCQLEDTVIISISSPPIANAGPDQTGCPGDSFLLQASGGISYQWSPSVYLDDPASATPLASPPNSSTYIVEVMNADQCSSTDTVNLILGEVPLIIAGPDQEICEGEIIQLTASGGNSYSWQGPSLSSNNEPAPTAIPPTSTTYIVTGTNLDGCSASDSTYVIVNPRPVAQIDGPGIICPGDTAILQASGGQSYVWSTGDTTSSIETNPIFSAQYTVTPFQGSCEGLASTFFLEVSENIPYVFFMADQDTGFAPAPVAFFNFTDNAVRYEWDFGTGALPSFEETPTHVFPHAGEFEVTLTAWSADGCPSSLTRLLRIENIRLFVPSAFSPNLDGYNDYFQIGQYGLGAMNIKIFSRWGLKVFESRELGFKWDGTYQGQLVPEGVYTYFLQSLGFNGKRINRSGTITVLR